MIIGAESKPVQAKTMYADCKGENFDSREEAIVSSLFKMSSVDDAVRAADIYGLDNDKRWQLYNIIRKTLAKNIMEVKNL